MTREEARKAAEVMLAYADGTNIEFKHKSEKDWETSKDFSNIGFNFIAYDYRVKQESTYRPFKDKEECWNEMLKHQPFGWVKDKKEGYLSNITIISDDNRFDCLNENYIFADGTPFGIKEE